MVNLKDKEGNTPLYDAVKPGSNKNIQLLLSYGEGPVVCEVHVVRTSL